MSFTHRDTSAGRSRGQFNSFVQKAKEAHRLAAENIQLEVAANLSKSIGDHGRPQRPTQELVHLVESKGFTKSGIDGFIVNPEGFLDRGKTGFYWRAIENGTLSHVGAILHGFWVDTSGRIAPDQSNYPRDKYQPTSKSGPGINMRINKPIIGYHFIRTAIDGFLEKGGIRQYYEAVGILNR